ncbi:MAG: metabolite traffic protein EboE [Candidatus Anammoximicrobium sp.]|nr:metabolite traffic protein EboE [Candidatus Anammoximicrobium sp.]
MTIELGYCTNVHAGADLDQTCAHLQQHATAVKRLVSPQAPLGIGLWLSAPAADALRRGARLEQFQDWLQAAGLVPFTLNGFPYGDFHQPVVKHRVYRPTWCERARLDYTRDLIAIQHQLLPAGREGSISTLPLLWGRPAPSASDLERCAENLAAVAEHLDRLQQETGRLIYVCLEPEPGCALQRSADVVQFFQRFLLPGRDERRLRRHIRVCHDVCHAAVMFEDQADAVERYVAAGIGIGKVQVSSAVALNLDELAAEDRRPAWEQLGGFREDRYLHQTCVRSAAGLEPAFFEDLPLALQTVPPGGTLQGQWRVHFHVPIYVARCGRLSTTQSDIGACLHALQRCPEQPHFEIETYAWTVLPEPLRQATLAEGIAAEIRWFRALLSGTLPAVAEPAARHATGIGK